MRNANDREDQDLCTALENISAILCNLSTVDSVRLTVLREALIPSLVETVLEATACTAFNEFIERRDSEPPMDADDSDWQPPYASVFFRNISAVVRYVG